MKILRSIVNEQNFYDCLKHEKNPLKRKQIATARHKCGKRSKIDNNIYSYFPLLRKLLAINLHVFLNLFITFAGFKKL